MSTSVVVTPKATQGFLVTVADRWPSTPVASGSRVPRRPLIGQQLEVFLLYVDPSIDYQITADAAFDAASGHNVLNTAARNDPGVQGNPSTAKGLLQAQDAVHHHMQANLHELWMLVAQQHVGYAELDDIRSPLCKIRVRTRLRRLMILRMERSTRLLMISTPKSVDIICKNLCSSLVYIKSSMSIEAVCISNELCFVRSKV